MFFLWSFLKNGRIKMVDFYNFTLFALILKLQKKQWYLQIYFYWNILIVMCLRNDASEILNQLSYSYTNFLNAPLVYSVFFVWHPLITTAYQLYSINDVFLLTNCVLDFSFLMVSSRGAGHHSLILGYHYRAMEEEWGLQTPWALECQGWTCKDTPSLLYLWNFTLCQTGQDVQTNSSFDSTRDPRRINL